MMIHYVDGGEESRQDRFERLLPLLACPKCLGRLLQQRNMLVCQICDASYPIRASVPILLPLGVEDLGAASISENDPVSRHPYSASASEIIATHRDGLVLDLGAGGKLDRYANVVQIDIFRYPAVDVVASADKLPFADNTFDAVVSQAVFEHLQYPEWAVSEIRRVLKAGGVAKIDTAFLQPEHGYPHHFFNATESGLRHWFRDFEIVWSGVESFQQPKWALHWFLGVYLDYIGPTHAAVLRRMSVGALTEMLQRHSSGETQALDAQTVEALDALPVRFQRVLAAGVSVRAVNRSKLPIVPAIGKANAMPASVDREREMELLRAEQIQMRKDLFSMQEMLRSANLKADYLFQFAPALDKSVVTFADVIGPKAVYLDTLAAGPNLGGLKIQPFATIVTSPSNVDSLLDTFFSLVAQVYGGWQLLIVMSKMSEPALTGIALRLTKVDGRVQLHSGELAADLSKIVEGEYCLHLRDGATLTSNAIEEVITAARFNSGVAGVSFDYERVCNDRSQTIRCYAQGPLGSDQTYIQTTACFLKVSYLSGHRDRDAQFSHLPISLMKLRNDNERLTSSLRARARYLTEQNLERSIELMEVQSDREEIAGELRKLSDDTANYLSQFYPESKNSSELTFKVWVRRSLSRALRHYLPISWWQGVQQLVRRHRGTSKAVVNSQKESTFATFLLEPTSATGLIHTFFSLAHQSYTGWQLVLIENHNQSPAVRRAIFDFKVLDKRIVVVNGTDQQVKTEQIEIHSFGKYTMQLVDGAVLRFRCLEQVVTLARDNAYPDEVACDYEFAAQNEGPSLRCYNLRTPGNHLPVNAGAFNGTFFRREAVPNPNASERHIAHLPKALFHLSRLGA